MAREPMERFEESFKAWAARPPEMSADEAAGQFLERLATREIERSPSGSTRPFWRWANVIAAVVLATVMTLRFQPGDAGRLGPSGPSGGNATAAGLEAPPLPDGVVVMWIDSETPLYLTMKTPEVPQGEPSK